MNKQPRDLCRKYSLYVDVRTTNILCIIFSACQTTNVNSVYQFISFSRGISTINAMCWRMPNQSRDSFRSKSTHAHSRHIWSDAHLFSERGIAGLVLTHWGRVTHICVGKLTIDGSYNGLSPDRRQAIIWTNAGILSIGPLGTKLSEILIAIHIFSFK